jgi:hypothetical protein
VESQEFPEGMQAMNTNHAIPVRTSQVVWLRTKVGVLYSRFSGLLELIG